MLYSLVSSENATIAELATTLQADLYQLQAAASSHAVTLYEAGKLGDSCIADLCNDLASLEGKRFEGVLQEFANHAFSLRCELECLLSGGTSTETADLTTRNIQFHSDASYSI